MCTDDRNPRVSDRQPRLWYDRCESSQYSRSMSHEPLPISEREREILRLVTTGATNQQIALALSISSNTVKVHLRNIFGKIGAASRTEATVWAIRNGLVTVADESAAAVTAIAEPVNEPPSAGEAAAREPVADEPAVAAVVDTGVPELSPTLPSAPSAAVVAAVTAAVPPPTPPAAVPSARRSRLPLLLGLLVTAVLLSIGGGLLLQARAGVTVPPPTAAAAGSEARRWELLAPLPQPVDRAALVAYEAEQQLFLFGGRTTAGEVTAAVRRYDLRTDRWSSVGAAPQALQDAAAVALRGSLYVVGGETAAGVVSDQLLMYDPAADRWQTGPALPAPRSRAAAAAWDGRLYLIGGWDGTTYRNEAFVYDPQAAAWSTIRGPAVARAAAAATVAAGRLYLIGGVNADGPLRSVEWLAESNDPQRSWQAAAALPAAVAAPIGVGVGGALLVFDSAAQQVLSFDRDRAAWASSALPAELAAGSRGGLLGDRVFLLADTAGGGQLSAYQALFTLFIPLR
jgi:DNA-binding CsgD family transcriptional regulator